MSGVPEVTVLMPVRDGARWLAEAADSIRRQSFANFEFLIVDDGSTDRTPEILASLAALDRRVRILRQLAGGIVAALNAGLADARAPLIARMDADDVAHEERLARQVAAMRARPELAALGTFYTQIDEAGRPGRLVELPTEPGAIAAALLVSNCVAHPTTLLRRDAVLKAGGYRAGFPRCEDYDLWLRLSQTHLIANLAEPLLQYRLHADQSGQRETRTRFLAEIAALESARRRRTGQSDPGGLEAGELPGPYGLSRPGLRRMLRDRSLGAARGLLGEGRREEALQALRVALAQGIGSPLTTLRLARLFAKAATWRWSARL